MKRMELTLSLGEEALDLLVPDSKRSHDEGADSAHEDCGPHDLNKQQVVIASTNQSVHNEAVHYGSVNIGEHLLKHNWWMLYVVC